MGLVTSVALAFLVGCGPGPDGPAFLYDLTVRNDTDALRIVVPISSVRAAPDSTAHLVASGGHVWAIGAEPQAGDVEDGRVLVFDADCVLVGDVTITPPPAQAAGVLPTYLLVVNDPTSVIANLVEAEPADVQVAPSSDLAARCPAATAL